MGFVAILFLAIGLSMDSLSVSIATAATCKQKNTFVFLRFAFTLGFIQAVCTIAGWAAGAELEKYFSAYDHWIAFGLLGIIGGKMIFEGIKSKNENDKPEINMNNFFVVTGLGIATSIDALVVGISLSFIDINIWWTSLVIFLVTFLFSYIGLFSGKLIKNRLKKLPVEIIGGLFLIGIGTKILIEHIVNGC